MSLPPTVWKMAERAGLYVVHSVTILNIVGVLQAIVRRSSENSQAPSLSCWTSQQPFRRCLRWRQRSEWLGWGVVDARRQ